MDGALATPGVRIAPAPQVGEGRVEPMDGIPPALLLVELRGAKDVAVVAGAPLAPRAAVTVPGT